MAEEVEVKFLNIDIQATELKLERIGAKKKGEYFQRWYAYDYPDWRLNTAGAWLRLRDEGDGRVTLSFKQRLGMENHDGTANDAGMDEVEVIVGDFEKTAQLIEKLGLIQKHYAEKKRLRWTKSQTVFDIDTYPQLEPYLEIEAKNWRQIDKAVELLGLDPADKKIFSANQVYKLKGIVVGDLVNISFKEGLVSRAIRMLP